jgi:hypothetical protein
LEPNGRKSPSTKLRSKNKFAKAAVNVYSAMKLLATKINCIEIFSSDDLTLDATIEQINLQDISQVIILIMSPAE